jgi:tRNA pseudouridine55 synthase
MNGYVLVNKEKNMTSFDLTRRVARRLGVSKAGHTGTLDPFAEGLMVVVLGRATKLAYLFSGSWKTYRAEVVLGVHYDTYDVTGTPERTCDVHVGDDDIRRVLSSFEGGYMQVPPMYSAIKKDGKKLYDLARKGIEVEREARFSDIRDITLEKPLEDNRFTFVARVSKGTYIRSLSVDIACALGTCGALRSLVRLSVGEYDLQGAKRESELTQADIVPVERLFDGLPRVTLNAYLTRLAQNGVRLDSRQTDLGTPFVAVSEDGEPVGYYEPDGASGYKPVYLFKE